MKKKRNEKPTKRKREKPVSLYGVPLADAIEDLLQSPPVRERRKKKVRTRVP